MTLEEHVEEGTTAVAMGEFEKAVEHFRKATELDPNHFEAWHSLGMACMKLQKYPEAIEAYQRSLSLEHGRYNPETLRNLRTASVDSVYMKRGFHRKGHFKR